MVLSGTLRAWYTGAESPAFARAGADPGTWPARRRRVGTETIPGMACRYQIPVLLELLRSRSERSKGVGVTVTIREVADAAGVSTATVSRALSGVQTVDPVLAERVRRSAESLGYRANRVARALRRQSTQAIGAVIPDLTNPFFPAVIQAVERELRLAGFSLLLRDAGNDVATEAELVQDLFDDQVDGLLISACDQIASQPTVQLAASRMPVLQVGRRAVAGLPYAGVDQADAMGQVIGHLTAQGCRSFAYIGPRPESSTARERLDAFTARMRPLDPGSAGRTYLGGRSPAWGREAAAGLLAGGSRPDAIVCADDLGAAGALLALREHGVRVPDDVALTGFGDTVVAEVCEPALTTVRQPLAELGARAVTGLRAALDRQAEQPGSAELKAELVVRASSRRARPAG
jgi:LacI family transcriptional regulator